MADSYAELVAYLRRLGLTDEEIRQYLERAGVAQPSFPELPAQGEISPDRIKDVAGALGLSGREMAILSGGVEPGKDEVAALDQKLAGIEALFAGGPGADLAPEEFAPSRQRDRRKAIINELIAAGVGPDDYDKVADVVTPSEFQEAITAQYGKRAQEPPPSPRDLAQTAKKLGLSGREMAVLAGNVEASDEDLRSLSDKLGVEPEILIDPATGRISIAALSRAAKRKGLSSQEFKELTAAAPAAEDHEKGVFREFASGFQRGLLATAQAATKGAATITGSKTLHRWAGELERAAMAADEVLGSEADSLPEEVASAVGEFLGQIAPSMAVAATAAGVAGKAAAGAIGFGAASFLPNVGDAADIAEKRFGVEDPVASIAAGFLMALLDTAAYEKGVGRLLGKGADEKAIEGIIKAVKAGRTGPAAAVVEGFLKLLSGQSKGAAVEATTEVAQDLIAKAVAAIDSGDWEAFKENLWEEASDTFTKVALGTFFGTAPGAGFSVAHGFALATDGGGYIEGVSPTAEENAAANTMRAMLERAGVQVAPQAEEEPQRAPAEPSRESAPTSEAVPEPLYAAEATESPEPQAPLSAATELDPVAALRSMAEDAEPAEREQIEAAAAMIEAGRPLEEAEELLLAIGVESEDELTAPPEDWVNQILASAQSSAVTREGEAAVATDVEDAEVKRSRSEPIHFVFFERGTPTNLTETLSGKAALQSAKEAKPRKADYLTPAVELPAPELMPPPGYRVVVTKLRTIPEAEGIKRTLLSTRGVAWVSRVGDTVVVAINPGLTSTLVASMSKKASKLRTLINKNEARIVSGGVAVGVGSDLRSALETAVFRKQRLHKIIKLADVVGATTDLGQYGLSHMEVLFAAGEAFKDFKEVPRLDIDAMDERLRDLLRFVNTRLNIKWVPLEPVLEGLYGQHMSYRSHSGRAEIIVTFGGDAPAFVLAHEIGHAIVARLRENGVDVDQVGETILRTVPDLRYNIRSRGYPGEEVREEAFAESFAYLMANSDDETRAKFLASSPPAFVAAVLDELAKRVTEAVPRESPGRAIPRSSYSKMFDAYHETLVNIFSRAIARIESIGPTSEFELVFREVTQPLESLPPEQREAVLYSRRMRREKPPGPTEVEDEARSKKYPPASPEDIARARAEYARIGAQASDPATKKASEIASRVVAKYGFLSPSNPTLPLGLPPTFKSGNDFVAAVEAVLELVTAGSEIGGRAWYERSLFDIAVGRLGLDWPISEHDARRIAAVLAVTSPRTSVKANVAIATAILSRAAQSPENIGKEFGFSILGTAVERAVKLSNMSSAEIAEEMDKLWTEADSPRNGGRKVKSFYEALVRESGFDPGTTTDPERSFVADTWVATATAVDPEQLGTSRAYDLLAAIFDEVAREAGATIHQAQASYWVALRSADRALVSGEAAKIVGTESARALAQLLRNPVFSDAETWRESFKAVAELARRFPFTETYGEAASGVFTSIVLRHPGADAGLVRWIIEKAVKERMPDDVAKLAQVHVSGHTVTMTLPLALDRETINGTATAIERIAESLGGDVSVRMGVLGRGIPETGALAGASTDAAKKAVKASIRKTGAIPFVILKNSVLAAEAHRAAVKAVAGEPSAASALEANGLDAEDIVHVAYDGDVYVVIDDSTMDTKTKEKVALEVISALGEVHDGAIALGSSRVVDLGGRGTPRRQEAGIDIFPEKTIRQRREAADVSQRSSEGPSEVSPTTVDDVVSMFGRAEELVTTTSEQREADARAIAKFERLSRGLRALLSDRLAPAFDALKKAFGPDYARRLLDDYRYSSGPAEAIVIRFTEVAKELNAAGVTEDEIGAWLFLRRIAGEEYHWDPDQGTWVHGPGKRARGRATVENPLGLTKEKAAALLEEFEKRLGPTRVAAIESAIDKLLSIYDRVMKEVRASNGFPQAAVEFMTANRFYTAFLFPHPIPDPLAEQPGAWPTGEVERQFGSTMDAVNPFFATAAKLAMLYQSAAKRRVQSEVIDALLELGLARKAPESGPPGSQQIATLWRYEGNERVRYWVPRSVAEALNSTPALGYLVGKALSFLNGLIRGAWVTYSPRFVAFNPVRDIRQTLMLLEQVKTPLDVAKFAREWLSTFREAWRAQTKEKSVAGSVVEAMEAKALGSGYIGTFDALAAEADIAEWASRLMTGTTEKPLPERFPIVGRVATFLRVLGEVQEQTTKVAALRFLKAKGVPLREAVDVVRTRVGTPNYRRAGRLGALLQFLFPFINVRKEGYRALVLSAKKDPGAFLIKTAVFAVIPAVVRWSLRTGLALALYRMFRPDDDDDDDEKAGIVMATKVMARATRGDFQNYDIIPLGIDADDKAVYLRLPQDHATQLIGGMTISILDGALRKRGDFASSFDLISDSLAYAAGEIPSVHPLVQFVTDTTMVALGFNPPDFWRGSYKVPRNVFEARDWRSLRYVAAKDLSALLGPLGFPISRLPELGSAKSDPLSVILKNPALDVTSGWVLRRTDAGLRDAVDRLIEQRRVERARRILKMDELISTAVEEGRPLGWVIKEARRAGLIKPTNRKQLMSIVRDVKSRYLEKKGVTVRKNYRHLTREELEAVEELLKQIGEELR